MATRLPIVQASGELQQLQSGDPLSPAAVSALRVIDFTCSLPANTTCIFLDSLTISNGGIFTVPNTSAAEVFNGRYSYWDSIVTLNANFVTPSTTFVDIPLFLFPTVANAVYEIEAVLRIQASDTNGIGFGGSNSGGNANGQLFAIATGALATRNDGATGFGGSSVAQFTQNFCTASGVDQRFTVLGIFMPGANPGNFVIQVKKVTAGSATVYAGSVIKMRRMI